MSLRLVGRVTRGADGRAVGQIALYSRDADAIVETAAQLGLVPPDADMLLRAGLVGLSQAPLDESLPGPQFPDPAEGELRLPIVFRDGQIILGGVPVGPAPLL